MNEEYQFVCFRFRFDGSGKALLMFSRVERTRMLMVEREEGRELMVMSCCQRGSRKEKTYHP
jgi:hypothetical protein